MTNYREGEEKITQAEGFELGSKLNSRWNYREQKQQRMGGGAGGVWGKCASCFNAAGPNADPSDGVKNGGGARFEEKKKWNSNHDSKN